MYGLCVRAFCKGTNSGSRLDALRFATFEPSSIFFRICCCASECTELCSVVRMKKKIAASFRVCILLGKKISSLRMNR